MSSVGRNSLIIASGTLASRITGMVRTILVAAALGTTGIAANAYQTGSSVPQIIYTLISGGLFNAILVPQIVKTLKSDDSKKQLDKLVTLSILILCAATAVIMAGTHVITSIYLNESWTAPQRALADAFTLWCTPQIFFYGLYTVLGQILAAKDRFAMYSWSSVAANVVSCIGFVVFLVLFGNAAQQPLDFWTTDKIFMTAGAWTLGVAIQAILLFIPLIMSGYTFSFSWGFRGIGLRKMGSVAVWSLAITIVTQIAGIILSRIATGAPIRGGNPYGIAGNGTYQNAFTIFILPYSLFAVSISTAIFPRISKFVSEYKTDRAARTLENAMRMSSMIMTFFTVVMIAIPLPLATVFLPSVSRSELLLLTPVLSALSLALPIASLGLFAQRTFYAFEDGKSPFIITAVQNAVTMLCQGAIVTFVQPKQWVTALGYSIAIGNFVIIPVLLLMLYRRLGKSFNMGRLVVVHLKIAVAAVPTYFASVWIGKILGTLLHFDSNSSGGRTVWFLAILICGMTTIIAGIVYSCGLVILRSSDFLEAVRIAVRRLHLDKLAIVRRMMRVISTPTPREVKSLTPTSHQ